MVPSSSKMRNCPTMNGSVHGERTASELQDRVTELIEQQTAISEVLRAIAGSPHDLQVDGEDCRPRSPARQRECETAPNATAPLQRDSKEAWPR
jgi:hypothetical protein